jgi:hypothetical protein
MKVFHNQSFNNELQSEFMKVLFILFISKLDFKIKKVD